MTCLWSFWAAEDNTMFLARPDDETDGRSGLALFDAGRTAWVVLARREGAPFVANLPMPEEGPIAVLFRLLPNLDRKSALEAFGPLFDRLLRMPGTDEEIGRQFERNMTIEHEGPGT